LLEVRLFIYNQWYAILEIDTSDNAKPLSTLIVQIHDLNKWNYSFKDIAKKIVKNSLRWPSVESLQDLGIPYTLNHPKHLVELTESDDEFNGWLQRMEKLLNL
ncbi:Tn7-like element transposition protein TnsE, partial [Acinetobacter sp. 11520]|nr:Tn7-like element transposition protein TnsE [Acinetobacter sp. 11520]